MRQLPCPCCGFLTLRESYGSYELCPVCDWEDDGVQLANPASPGGANHESLATAQAAVLKKFPLGIKVARGARRGDAWRPLNAGEVEAAEERCAVEHWYFPAVLSEAEAYWSSTPNPSFQRTASGGR